MAASVGRFENTAGIKRRRSTVDEDLDEMQHDIIDGSPCSFSASAHSTSFVYLSGSHGTLQSVDYKVGKETMYLPIGSGDVMINVRNIDQVTCEKGTFFMGDENSKYIGSTEGMFLW